jgi:hypothetical protein
MPIEKGWAIKNESGQYYVAASDCYTEDRNRASVYETKKEAEAALAENENETVVRFQRRT